jgi:hypothetical protein
MDFLIGAWASDIVHKAKITTTRHRLRLITPLKSMQHGERGEVTFLYTNIGDRHSKADDSSYLLEASLGLLKIDNVPDCGEVLHEQVGHFLR